MKAMGVGREECLEALKSMYGGTISSPRRSDMLANVFGRMRRNNRANAVDKRGVLLSPLHITTAPDFPKQEDTPQVEPLPKKRALEDTTPSPTTPPRMQSTPPPSTPQRTEPSRSKLRLTRAPPSQVRVSFAVEAMQKPPGNVDAKVKLLPYPDETRRSVPRYDGPIDHLADGYMPGPAGGYLLRLDQ